mgnify:CR=1 FL=1
MISLINLLTANAVPIIKIVLLKIIQAACEQSESVFVPELTWTTFTQYCLKGHQPILFHPYANSTWPIDAPMTGRDLLIGPEGDFSVKELDLLKELGVKLFSLGNRKLRAETAAQTTLSILNEFLD